VLPVVRSKIGHPAFQRSDKISDAFGGTFFGTGRNLKEFQNRHSNNLRRLSPHTGSPFLQRPVQLARQPDA
jgi:hypothetical protein